MEMRYFHAKILLPHVFCMGSNCHISYTISQFSKGAQSQKEGMLQFLQRWVSNSIFYRWIHTERFAKGMTYFIIPIGGTYIVTLMVDPRTITLTAIKS